MTDENLHTPGFFRQYPCGPKVPEAGDAVTVFGPPAVPALQIGWKCPGCGRCHAPAVRTCPHCGPEERT